METYNGQVKSPADAIILFEACRLGLLPRIQRRLSEKERQLIKSGSVFVWDEREAGMRRWTDGKSWSASRVSGSFLTYREMEGKRGGSGFSNSSSSSSIDKDGKRNSQDSDMNANDGPDGYRYKADGLMKQSFSITTTTGQHLHLISYHARSHPHAAQLQTPSTDPNLRHIHPAKGLYPESTVHDQQNLPAVTRSPMVGSPLTTSPHQHMGPNTQNYLRHQPATAAPPPPPQQPHSPAYTAWPPSPLPTPGSTYYPSPHSSGYMRQAHSSPAASSVTGPSPLHMAQPAYPRNPAPTAFDRAPPPMSNPSWPPPPPQQQHQQHHTYSPQQQQHHHHQHSPAFHHVQSSSHLAQPPTSAPSPYTSSSSSFSQPNRSPDDRSAASLPAPGGGHARGGIISGPTDHHAPKHYHHHQPSPQLSHGSASPYASHYSYQESPPRPSSNGVHVTEQHHQHHQTTPPPPLSSSSSSMAPPKEATKMIPSIKALINRTPSPLHRQAYGQSPSMMAAAESEPTSRYRSVTGTPERDSRPSSSGHVRYGAAAPPTSTGAASMSEKMQFGEDMRALRQLDRAFAA